MSDLKTLRIFLLMASVLWTSSITLAQDRYYTLSASDLGLQEQDFQSTQIPEEATQISNPWRWEAYLQPRVSLSGEGEAYFENVRRRNWGEKISTALPAVTLHVRVPAKTPVLEGRLFLTMPGELGEHVADFSVKVADLAAFESNEMRFRVEEARYYSRLRARNIPGAAWFRYQENQAALETEDQQLRRATRTNDRLYNDTFSLFSGGRALSENLQLDRDIPLMGEPTSRTVDIESITGITTEEIDWEEITRDIEPELDLLADYIPHDQHAIFFSSFSDMLRLRDEAAERGTPILHLMEVRAEDARSQQDYERQLALHTDTLSRMLGPTLIRSVAFTGSDPYLRTGADVAVLFDAIDGPGLRAVVEARQRESGMKIDGARKVSGNVGGVPYSGVVSPGRVVSSYLIVLDNVIIVSNSKAQLGRLVDAHKQQSAALSSLPEYHFFRDRYTRGDGEETGLLILTDATIRRWCSPRWRIGASRRARAAAILAELEARRLDGKSVEDYPVPFDFGQVQIMPGGVMSERYGRVDFLTPISELDLTFVSKREREAYNRFRQTYQRAWRAVFDPIAIRFGVDADHLSMDLTVRPLIARSDYREMMEVTSGKALEARHGDPHPEAVFQVVASLNADSQPVREVTNFARSMAQNLPGDPLKWLGGWMTVFADSDPFWEEFEAASRKGDRALEDFMEQNYNLLPVAVEFDVNQPFALAGFITAVRGFIEQSAPDLTQWETRKHNEMSYVRVGSSEGLTSDGPELALFYAARPEGFLLTLSEDLLKRSLDRWAARKKEAADQTDTPANPTVATAEEEVKPWMGENLALRANARSLEVAHGIFDERIRDEMMRRSWANIPILNTWREMYPDSDPVLVHERHFGIRPVCPGGGVYVWNVEYRTMESSVFGHPGQPRFPEEGIPGPLRDIISAEMGLTFEADGLRARARVERNGQ